MLPYLFLLLITVFSPFVIYQKRSIGPLQNYSEYNDYIVIKRNKMSVFVFFAGLLILLALRGITVGRDLLTYKSIFEICSVTPFENLGDMQWELGYTVFNKIISSITEEYRFFLIVIAFITIIPIYKLYSKENRYSYLLIVLFINMPCFLMVFSGLRQAVAISIGVFVYMALEKKKYVLSFLLILLATSFHISAFVLILLYPMFFIKIKTKHMLYIIPILLVIFIFRVPILKFAISFMPSTYIKFYNTVQQTGAYGMMVLFLIFAVFSFVILDEEVMSKKDYFLRNLLLLSTVFQFFVSVHGLVQRASYYFLIFVPISILSVVQAPKRRWGNISNLAVVVMSCFFTLYFFYNAAYSTDNLLDVFPYTFFWSDQIW